MKYLCVNAGSSSLKFQLFEMPEEKVIISGYIEKIGLEDSFWTTKINGEKIKGARFLRNHNEAVEVLIEELLKYHAVEDLNEIKAVGHRTLHGGEKYADSVIIDDEVIANIKSLTKLGPLHHPGNLAGIEAMQKALPGVPMVAVYDTAFHQTMPKVNYMYPVPMEWYEKYGVRKYGFHGTSHKYITETMKNKLNKEDCNLIICHIGSGASISAVKNGKCYDTTMGLTPLDGLMMGTRSGAIDPSIVEYVCKESGMGVEEVNNLLNKKSGLLGISGYSDSRDVENAAKEGNENAKLALEMYNNRIAKYIAEYYIELEGKVDASDVQKAEAARDELKAAVEANDLEAMKVKRDALNEVVQNLTVKLYEQAAAAQQAAGASQEGPTEQASSNNDGVVDADFEEVD